MPTLLFAPEMLPFSVALGLMLLLLLLELVGLLFGASPSQAAEGLMPEAGTHAPTAEGAPDGWLGWLGVGRVPVLMLLVVFLCGFGISGYALQAATIEAAGFALHPALASLGALAAALPITHWGAGLLARVMPKSETEAVSLAGFEGQVATITTGVAQAGLAAEAKLQDGFGQTHYVRVEPEEGTQRLPPGTRVRLLRRQGAVWLAAPETTEPTTNQLGA